MLRTYFRQSAVPKAALAYRLETSRVHELDVGQPLPVSFGSSVQSEAFPFNCYIIEHSESFKLRLWIGLAAGNYIV